MGDGFCIETYLWLRNTTSVHDHSFSGAWRTLVGSSIHRRFVFVEQARLTPSLRLGALSERGLERLEPGMVRTIETGETMIHDLFHLHQPTMTLILRSTGVSPQSGKYRQQEYIGFGADAFAWDSFDRPDHEVLQIRLARSMVVCDPAEGLRQFAAILDPADPEPGLRCLDGLLVDRPPSLGRYFAAFKKVYGALGERLVGSLLLKGQNMRARRLTQTPDESLVFGLLRAPMTRKAMMDHLTRWVRTDEPHAWVMDQLESIARHADAQNSDFGLSPMALAALRHELLGSRDASDGAMAQQRFVLEHHPTLSLLMNP